MTITSNDKCQISLVYTNVSGCFKATSFQLVPSDIRTYSGTIAWLVDVTGHSVLVKDGPLMPHRRYKLSVTGPTLVVARTVRCMLEIVMAARYGIILRDVSCISSRGW